MPTFIHPEFCNKAAFARFIMAKAIHMLSDEITEKVKTLAKGVVTEESPDVDRKGKWPENSIRAIQKAGLGGLVIPKESGGLGQGLTGMVKTGEILGEVNASTSLCFGMHCVGAAVIAAKATPQQKKQYLEPIVQGRHLTTLAVSEPGTGAHFYYPQTQLLALSNQAFEVKGKKSFITNGGYADSYVVSTMAAHPDAPPNLFSVIVVNKETPGMVWGPEWNGLGMRGNSSKELELNRLRVSTDQLLGEQGDQLWYIFNVVAPYFLLAMSGTYLGIAQAAFNEAQNHLMTRTYAHSGSGLAQVHILQHRMGSLWANIERTRRLIYHAAALGDQGDLNALPAILSAKAEVANCVTEVVNEAMTLTGGIAYQQNSRLELLMRDARAAHVMAPTTDILYTWLGRAILEQPILAD